MSKKVYSNEDTATGAIFWFWKNFDADKYSIWHGTYNHSGELPSLDFMCGNLLGGTVQRLEMMRKHGFAVFLYFNKPTKSLEGLSISRGPVLPFSLSDSLNVDAEGYTWRQVNPSDEKDKKLVNAFLLWEGDFNGKELYTGEVFK
jgi:elongation factor 1-gamma